MSNHPDGFESRSGLERLAWEPLLTPSLSTLAPPGSLRLAGPRGEDDWSAAGAPASGMKVQAEDRSGGPAHVHPAGSGFMGSGTGENKIKAMAAKKKEKMEMPVCTRVSVSTFRTLDIWCDNSFRKRSEVIGLLLERIVEIISQQHCIEQPVEEFARNLCLGPRA